MTEKCVEKIFVDFVEGRISPALFAEALMADEANGSLYKEYLSDPSLKWQGTYLEKDGPFLYLLTLDYSNIVDIVDALGAVELFLNKKGIQVKPDTEYEKLYDLILAVQPSYLDVNILFITKHIYPSDVENLPKSEIRQVMRQRFEDLFKYQSKPPQWLQAPAWPIEDEVPLFFVGQLRLSDESIANDMGYVYVFFNREKKSFVNVAQFY